MSMMPKDPNAGGTDQFTAGQPIKKNNALLVVVAVAVVFIAFLAGIIGLVFMAGSPMMKSGETFLNQISNSQADTAYESTSIQFKQSVPKEKFNDFLIVYPVLTKVKSTSFNSFSIENSFADISGTLTATDGQVSPINMQLVNENGQWRVLNLDLTPTPPGSVINDN